MIFPAGIMGRRECGHFSKACRGKDGNSGCCPVLNVARAGQGPVRGSRWRGVVRGLIVQGFLRDRKEWKEC